MKLHLHFEIPEYVSSQGTDKLEITFWGSNAFIGKDGQIPMNQGVKIETAVFRQYESEDQADLTEGLISPTEKVLKTGLTISFITCLLLGRSMVPFWAMINTL